MTIDKSQVCKKLEYMCTISRATADSLRHSGTVQPSSLLILVGT